jgi:hypothetical protein
MAYDLILRKQNTLNLSFLSSLSGDDLGRGTASLDTQARAQLAAFSKRLATLNKTISEWYAQNKSNPAANPFVNRFIAWRDQAYGYIRAYAPKLAGRFLKETPPKEQQLLALYSQWRMISGVAAQSRSQAQASQSATPAASPMPPAPPPAQNKPSIRTARSKARTSSPSTQANQAPPPAFSSPSSPSPALSQPEPSGPGRIALIAGAAVAAIGGGYLLAKSASGKSSRPRAAGAGA